MNNILRLAGLITALLLLSLGGCQTAENRVSNSAPSGSANSDAAQTSSPICKAMFAEQETKAMGLSLQAFDQDFKGG